LQKAKLDRVVVGHTITPNADPILDHPVYGNKLIMMDTAISSGFDGNLSAMEWVKDKPIKAYEFVRDTTPGMSEDELLFDEKEGIDYVAPPPDLRDEFNLLHFELKT